MRRIVFIGLIVITMAAATFAQTTAGASEKLTIGATAIGITPSVLRWDGVSASTCSFTLEDAQIRMMWHGGTPTTTEGEPVSVGQRVTINGVNNLRAWRAIRTTGTSGVARVTCEH